MRKCQLLFTLILICAIFCGCVDTPENLKNKNNGLASAESGSDLTADFGNFPETSGNSDPAEPSEPSEPVIDFSSLAERGDLEIIRSQLDLDLQKTYANITVRRARVGEGDVMPAYDIKIGGDPEYDLKKLADYLYPGVSVDHTEFPIGSVINENRPATTEPTIDENTGHIFTINTYEYGIEKFVAEGDPTRSCYYYSTGNLWGSQTGSNQGQDSFYGFEKFKTSVRYDLDYDVIDSAAIYKMSDGEEWSVTEAVKFVEDFWNERLSPSDPMKFIYSVKTVWALSTGDDSFGYLFEMQRKDENGNYYDVESADQYLFDEENPYIKGGEPFIYANEQMTWCAGKEVITRYAKDFSFGLEDLTNSGEDLLTLGAAADILSETLARRINLDLTAELNYAAVCKSYPYYSIWEYPFYSDPTCITSCEFELRPLWCFRKDQCTLKLPSAAEIYFVDAITGEVSMIIDGKFKKAEHES